MNQSLRQIFIGAPYYCYNAFGTISPIRLPRLVSWAVRSSCSTLSGRWRFNWLIQKQVADLYDAFRTVLSIIMFPVLQYNFSRDVYDPTYKEIMPELVYGCGECHNHVFQQWKEANLSGIFNRIAHRGNTWCCIPCSFPQAIEKFKRIQQCTLNHTQDPLFSGM